jgi:nucleoid-associated protein YgaU
LVSHKGMKMKKQLKFALAFGLILTLGACSSSQTTQSEEGADPAAAAASDAGTDAVPQESAENVEGTAQAELDALAQSGDTPPADPAAAQEQPPVDGVPPATDPAAAALAEQTPPPIADVPPAAVEQPQPEQQFADSTPPSPAGSGQYENVTVQAGDTLMKIAFETYGDLYRWKSILEANRDKVTDPNQIPVGTVLKIERPATHVAIERNGEKYLIKNGDTLGTISNDVYGTQSKWRVLWENNKQMIHDPNRIFAGFYLYYQPDHSTPPQQEPMLDQQPLADAPAPGPAPTLAVPTPGDVNTASNTADSARAPASNDAMAAPPADAAATPEQTVTQ